MVQAFLNNELDFISHPDPQVAQGHPEELRHHLSFDAGLDLGLPAVQPGRQFRSPPIQNKLVRQAISYAIDREAIANEIYYGEATPTDNQIPQGYMGHRGHLLRYPKNGDLAKARELMAQAGLSGGYEVEVITSDKDWLRKELELVAAMVSQIGITYKIQNMDMGGYNNLWLNRRYNQLLEDITMNGPDPDATSWSYLNGQTSRGYDNPKMTRVAHRCALRVRSSQARAHVPPDRRHDAGRVSDDLPRQSKHYPGLQQASLLVSNRRRRSTEMMDSVYWG